MSPKASDTKTEDLFPKDPIQDLVEGRWSVADPSFGFKVPTRKKSLTVAKGTKFYTAQGDSEAVAVLQQTREVDTATFTKVYSSAIAVACGDFTASEHRLLWLLVSLSHIRPGQYKFILSLQRVNLMVGLCSKLFATEYKPFKKSSFFAARKKLLERAIILPVGGLSETFAIHPDFCFNGDRTRLQFDVVKIPSLAEGEYMKRLTEDAKHILDII